MTVSRFVPFADRYRSPFESVADTRARVLLRTLAYANVPFANEVTLRGAEELRGPAVIVTAHLFLNALLLRSLVERGHALAIVRATPADPPYLAGSAIPLENLLISPSIFVKLRSRLRNGEIAFINIDQTESTRWQAHGLSLSDAAIAFARRMDVPLFFAATRIVEGRIVGELRRASGTVDEVMEDLQAFLTVAHGS